jgi:hypothetical protein
MNTSDVVCVLVSTFAPMTMINGFSRYDLSKRITTIVGVFSSYEEYLETMKVTSQEKIEKYARCKLHVENKRLPYGYGYEGSSPQLEYGNRFRRIPYKLCWSGYFQKDWNFDQDPDIANTDHNIEYAK